MTPMLPGIKLMMCPEAKDISALSVLTQEDGTKCNSCMFTGCCFLSVAVSIFLHGHITYLGVLFTHLLQMPLICH